MIQSLADPIHAHLFSGQLSKRLEHLFFVCIAISLATHVILLFSVIGTKPAVPPGAIVSYIDVKDIMMPAPRVISDNNPPVQTTDELQDQVAPPPIATTNAIQSTNQVLTSSASTNDLTSALVLGMANGYFSSLADGRTLRDDIHGYYFDILEKINHKWWQSAGSIKEVAQQDGIIEILIGRDGKLLDVRQMRTTGSSAADRAIMNAITEAAPFPDLPTSYDLEIFRAPLKMSKPSYLLGTKDLR